MRYHTSNDGLADHFVVIVGQGIDDNKNLYFRFFDPGTAYAHHGAGNENRFLLENNKLVAQLKSNHKKYIVSQIRPK